MITDTETIEKIVNKRLNQLIKKADNISSLSSIIRWTKRAIDYFGTTLKPHEAGYVLYNGQMLDFSGGHADQRRLDHPDIFQMYTDKELEKADLKYKFKGKIFGTNIIKKFQRESDAIRLSSAQYSGIMNISIQDSQLITSEQLKTLEYISNYDTPKHIIYDVLNEDSRAVKYGETSSVSELKDKLVDYIDKSLKPPKESYNSTEYHPLLLNAYGLINEELLEVINNSEEKLQYESMFKFLDFYARLSDPMYRTTNEEINFYCNFIKSRMLGISYSYEQHAIDSGDVDEEEELIEISEKAKNLSKFVGDSRLDKLIYLESIIDFEHTTGSIIPLIFNISDYGDADYWAKRLLDYLRKN